MLLCLIVVLSALSKAGMRNALASGAPFSFYGIPHLINFNPSGIVKAKCQLIAVGIRLRSHHGISPSVAYLYHCYLRTWNDSHIEEVLPQRTLSSYGTDSRRFSDRQFFQCHICLSLLILIIINKYMTRFDCGQAPAAIYCFLSSSFFCTLGKPLEIRVWNCLGGCHHGNKVRDLTKLNINHLLENPVNLFDSGSVQQNFFPLPLTTYFQRR